MAKLAEILKDLTLFVDGRGYAGQIGELTTPKLSLKTEEFRAGGMDAPIELDMGMEKLVLEASLQSYDRELFKLFGLTKGAVVPMTVRGAIDQEGTVTPLVINVRGQITEIDEGAWKPGEKGGVKITVSCRYYKRTQGGEVLHEIDVENMIRIIGGVDQLAERRKALGL